MRLIIKENGTGKEVLNVELHSPEKTCYVYDEEGKLIFEIDDVNIKKLSEVNSCSLKGNNDLRKNFVDQLPVKIRVAYQTFIQSIKTIKKLKAADESDIIVSISPLIKQVKSEVIIQSIVSTFESSIKIMQSIISKNPDIVHPIIKETITCVNRVIEKENFKKVEFNSSDFIERENVV